MPILQEGFDLLHSEAKRRKDFVTINLPEAEAKTAVSHHLLGHYLFLCRPRLVHRISNDRPPTQYLSPRGTVSQERTSTRMSTFRIIRLTTFRPGRRGRYRAPPPADPSVRD